MENQEVRHLSANLYAQWIKTQIDAKGWTPAILARRSGLSKTIISNIMQGKQSQPTAWQIAQLARALSQTPSDIFREIGLWNAPDTTTEARQVSDIYTRMSAPFRLALIHLARTMLALQHTEEQVASRHKGPMTLEEVELSFQAEIAPE